jgi:MFS family permease
MDKPTRDTAQSGFEAPPITEREKNVIIAGVLLSMLLAALDQTIVAPALPTIGASLGHADYLPWIVTGYLLTATAMAPLYGKISDVYGRRATIFAAILVFLAGSVVSASSPNMFVLIAGRAIQGLGGGGLFALTQTVIGDLVPPRERAQYAAWISGTWAIASVAGPLVGGYFAEHLSWSLIFWINIPLGLAAMAALSEPLRKLPIAGRHHRIDIVGALLLVVATSLLLLALNWAGSTFPWASAPILGLFAGSALVWGLLARRLLSVDEPLISLEVLNNRIVLTATMSMFLGQAAFIGLSVYLPIYMQSFLGISVSGSGMGLLGLLLGTVAGAMASGKIIPRFYHYKRIAVVGASISAVCLLAFGLVAQHANLAMVELLTIMGGIGAGATFPVATVSVQNAVDRSHLGVATGVLTFLRSLGGALGVAVLGAIALGYGVPLGVEVAQSVGHVDDAGPFAVIFLVTAGIMAASLLVLLLMPEKALQGRVAAAPSVGE